MLIENILLKFLLVICLLFFLPKVVKRFLDIPYPITEILLGILLALLLPSFFGVDDMMSILSTLGIITLFVYAGMEVDSKFLLANKKFFVDNLARHVLIFAAVTLGVQYFFSLSFHISLLVSLALTTPSASYILSTLHETDKRIKPWIEGKAIAGEIFALGLLVILLRIGDLTMLIITLLCLIALILILPLLLKFLYKKIFSRLIGTEFTFIFIVALLAAFVTEYLGIHFLVGAFIAGVVSRRFITGLLEDQSNTLNYKTAEAIKGSFSYFSFTFAPFYFFTIGLTLNLKIFTWYNLLIALGLVLAIGIIIVLSIATHRIMSQGERMKEAFHRGSLLLPTLIFTFVIAGILLKEFSIPQQLYSILMLYGILTAVLSLILTKMFE